MKSTLRYTTESDAPAIATFLSRVFEMPIDHPTVLSDNLRWKYWAPHPGAWPGSRSAVLERERTVVAHAAAWPLRLRTDAADLEAVHVIDWAADAAAAGAGVSIMKQMTKQVPVTIAVGGSDITRRILPPFGFKVQHEIRLYARPLQPLRQALTHQSKNWKLPARFIRNLAWRYRPALELEHGWSLRPSAPESIPDSVLPAPSAKLAVFARSSPLFEYLARCPVAKSALYIVEHNGSPKGYFCLFLIPGAARVADAWAISDEAWRAVYTGAAQEARRHGAAEIVTVSALPAAERALAACGYRPRGDETLVVYDPGGRLPAGLTCHVQMIDSDKAFWHRGTPDYVT